MFHVDRPLYLLGYIPSQQRVYLIDREYSGKLLIAPGTGGIQDTCHARRNGQGVCNTGNPSRGPAGWV
jgi:hypothetical protein